jgi:Universal stress protein UspA and related nucleotide-binding proteins
MKGLSKILVPTDLSEHSRRALLYGCWLAADDKASLLVLHVANELNAWEYQTDELALVELSGKTWPVDRVLSEANLDLVRFLEPSLASLKKAACVTKRVVLGSIAEQIAAVAEEENADLVIMSPQRHRGWHHLLFGAITDQVTRLSPCPVLSIAPPQPSKPGAENGRHCNSLGRDIGRRMFDPASAHKLDLASNGARLDRAQCQFVDRRIVPSR